MSVPESKASVKNLFPEISVDGIKFEDIWRAWQITEEFKEKVKFFDNFLIEDNLRWDEIADRIYGDRELWWVTPLFNDIEDPFSISFDQNIDIAIKSVRILKPQDLAILLDTIREKRLDFEIKGTSEEEI